jgi:hypothetical protein
MSSVKDAENNVSAFFDRYGKKGFLELYFTNYLFELLMAYVRSKSDDIEYDSGYQYHFGKDGKFLPPTDEKQFRDEAKKECTKKAKAIVAELDRRGVLERFGDMQSLTEQATELVDEAIRETFEKVFKVKWPK